MNRTEEDFAKGSLKNFSDIFLCLPVFTQSSLKNFQIFLCTREFGYLLLSLLFQFAAHVFFFQRSDDLLEVSA